jgi:quinol monooxygenase YgiN
MSIATVTRFHVTPGHEEALLELLMEGRGRMHAARGCESFSLLRDEADPQSLVFLQRWATHEAHNAAFSERILETGHLEKVLATLDEPIVQNVYEVVP